MREETTISFLTNVIPMTIKIALPFFSVTTTGSIDNDGVLTFPERYQCQWQD